MTKGEKNLTTGSTLRAIWPVPVPRWMAHWMGSLAPVAHEMMHGRSRTAAPSHRPDQGGLYPSAHVRGTRTALGGPGPSILFSNYNRDLQTNYAARRALTVSLSGCSSRTSRVDKNLTGIQIRTHGQLRQYPARGLTKNLLGGPQTPGTVCCLALGRGCE
jgi:hypothetical protein